MSSSNALCLCVAENALIYVGFTQPCAGNGNSFSFGLNGGTQMIFNSQQVDFSSNINIQHEKFVLTKLLRTRRRASAMETKLYLILYLI